MARLKNPRLWFWTILVVAAMVAGRLYAPAPLPHIQLPAEAIPGWQIGPLAITNTIVALIVTDVLLLALGWAATRKLDMVPHGLQNLVEAVIEFWEDLSIQMVGADLTKVWLPLALTLFFIIWVANWSELVPGYDTVGKAVAPPAAHAEAAGGAAEAAPALFRVDGRLGPVQAL
ncbi:MAG: F0F1 ATP synthase subunit A, partial [Anaerolineae bacterium]